MKLPGFGTPAANAIVFGLVFIHVVTSLAHGGDSEDGGERIGSDHGHEEHDSAPESLYLPTYFAHADHAGLIVAHIALMIAAWVFALPVAVVLSLAKSRYTWMPQLVFLITNTIGVLLVVVYNTRTPDLYPGNAHHSIGWIVTCISSAEAFVSLLSSFNRTVRNNRSIWRYSFIPSSAHADQCRGHGFYSGSHRLSNDSGQGSDPSTESLHSSLGYSIGGSDDNGDNSSVNGHRGSASRCSGYTAYSKHQDEDSFDSIPVSSDKAKGPAAKMARLASSRMWWRCLEIACSTVHRIILPFGFIALTTGIVTLGRFFESGAFLNGLAHWVKGGIFLWLGIFTLGRWCGTFGELGWAWNVRPGTKQRQVWRPSAEFVESALIFLYGSTNIFLEHLGSWGGEWASRDLEHVSITVLFLGGGMCGMLIESNAIRDLLNTRVSYAVQEEPLSGENGEQTFLQPPETYGFSLNPIPALVIMLLGVIMGSHEQSSMTSSMVHKQWGNLLLGASLARILTYVLVFLRPPASALPSRPPTELLTAFGLMAGGVIFMASSADTIQGMIHYDLDAMFIYTMTMGFVGLLMAWEIVVLAIKGWALRRRQRDGRHIFA